MKKIFFLFLLFFCVYAFAQEQDANEILKKVDANYVADNRRVTTTMNIREQRGTRSLQAQAWIQGMDESFVEYLSPARDNGTKMLKLGNELWIYTPSTDRTIKIAGHMLRLSVMGSDLSYEDYMEDPVLSNMYAAELTGVENISGKDCYVLKLTAKVDNIAYHSRKMWVDMETFLPMKEERYAKGGKLLKSLIINEVIKVGDRWYPKNMVFKDVLKDSSGTEFIFDSIEFDVDIPGYIFSKASLKK